MDKYMFDVQSKKKIRVIIDTDAACEADDQYAIVHALLTPRFDICGIIAEQFYSEGGEKSVDKSFNEINRILDLMNINNIQVYKGAYLPLNDENQTLISDGADFIIKEALKEDERPLFLLCQGAITNVAMALGKAPEIARKITCIWIGGGVYPNGGWEFNLMNDYHAANVVFKSGIDLWQVPMDCYTQIQVGYAELQVKVRPYGKIGRYLFDEMQEVGMTRDWVCGECWGLGDSPVVGLALNPGCGWYDIKNSPVVDENGYYINENANKIRVYKRIDSRFILKDFFAKLRINFPAEI